MNSSRLTCSAERQRVAQRLGNEQESHREVDGGAVEVEGVSGRHDDAGDGLAHAGVLHLGDQAGKGRLRRRRRDDQQELPGQVLRA